MANNIAGDFALNGLGKDLLIQNGDFQIWFDPFSTNSNIYDILMSAPALNGSLGDWLQFPQVGCSLPIYQNGQINGLSGIIRKQLLADGINILSFNLSINNNSEMDVNITGNR